MTMMIGFLFSMKFRPKDTLSRVSQVEKMLKNLPPPHPTPHGGVHEFFLENKIY